MIILSQTTDNLQAVLAGTVATNQLQCVTSWRDVTTNDYTPGRTLINTNNSTAVNIAAAPAASTQRIIDYISVYNRDTTNRTLTIKINANGTEYVLWKGLLATGEMVEYTDKNGFVVKDSSGRAKVAYYQNSGIPTTNTLNTVVLSGDVVNNNATANSIADVTGLSFDVTAGQTYYFEFIIPYTSASTTTGSRWSINGPAITLLSCQSQYTLTATSVTQNSITAYDIPAASNATSLTTGNVATIWGIITPAANGTVIARFASEVANSAITAKAGAMLRWIRLI